MKIEQGSQDGVGTRTQIGLSTRLSSLDSVRGFAILCMLILHYPAFYNYVAPQRLGLPESIVFTGAFYFKWTVFCPLVEQIFVALAAFNLAKRTSSEMRAALPSKLKLFGLVGFAFFLVQFVAWSENLGMALTFSPIHSWMLILAVIASLYAWLGVWGIVGAFVLSWTLWVLPISGYGDALQAWVVATFDIPWEFDARPELFFGSGAFGFLIGWMVYHGRMNRLDLAKRLLLLAPLLFLAWGIAGAPLSSSRTALFASEHEVMGTFIGALSVWGQLSLVFGAALWLELRRGGLRVPVLHWLGVNSLLIFAVHQIFWSRLLLPGHLFLSINCGFPIRSNDLVDTVQVGLTILFVWWLKERLLSRGLSRVSGRTQPAIL